MKWLKINIDRDKLGISASVLCAAHCALLPVLITLFPLLGIGFLMKDWVEVLMIVTSVLIAGFSLAPSYKLHQKRLPIILLLIGIGLIVLAHSVLQEKLEPFVLPAGGLTIASAHYFNRTYVCTCNHGRPTIPNTAITTTK